MVSNHGTSRFNCFKRKLLASLLCAGASSQPPIETGDHLDEKMTGSLSNLVNQHSSPTSCSETGLSSFCTGSEELSGSGNHAIEDTAEDGLCNNSKISELLSQQVNVNDNPVEAHADSSSAIEEPSTELISTDTVMENHVRGDPGHLNSDWESAGDANMVSDSLSVVPGSIESPPLPRFLLSDGDQDPRPASMVFVDVVSINSNILSSSVAEISSHERRRNSRRMFWDGFSRSSFRGNRNSPTIVFTTSHADDLGSHDRWLLDFSADLYNGVGRESRYSGTRSRHWREQRWQTRYEMPERFHDIPHDQGWQTSLCPTGRHRHGTCSCESLFVAEESNSHAGISQIILLADALFEVLEEIHRYRMSPSLSMRSLPAPEAVVNSLPFKNHKKSNETENGTCDVQQCHICLAEYEEGDKIRVLPCSHEYHMLCVDKWLKEIHGVCPLCREDVCKGTEVSASTPEIASL